jgi:hypothetical protein
VVRDSENRTTCKRRKPSSGLGVRLSAAHSRYASQPKPAPGISSTVGLHLPGRGAVGKVAALPGQTGCGSADQLASTSCGQTHVPSTPHPASCRCFINLHTRHISFSLSVLLDITSSMHSNNVTLTTWTLYLRSIKHSIPVTQNSKLKDSYQRMGTLVQTSEVRLLCFSQRST